MLNLAELKRIASREGVPAAIIEKDYALSVALNSIFESGLSEHLVFKGGTAIRKAYFKDARFSEDLDFTVLNTGKEQVFAGLNGIFEGKTIDGIVFQKPAEEKTPAGLKVSIKYTGPLMYAQKIQMDFNFRDNLVGKPVRRNLADPYGSGGYGINVLTLEELFAEKINALGTRCAPRDLVDVWFLFGRGVKADKEMIEKKFAYYNEKLDLHVLESALPGIRGNWHNDLRQLMPKVPPIEPVFNEVVERLRSLKKS